MPRETMQAMKMATPTAVDESRVVVTGDGDEHEGVRYLCPCCRYPTLGGRGHFEVCVLCHWEDDGQDDPYADEVRGGPNWLYSLSRARANFRDHLNQYDADDPMGDESPLERDAKRSLVATFDAILDERNYAGLDILWLNAFECERVIRDARYARVASEDAEEHERRHDEFRERWSPGYIARKQRSIAIQRSRHPPRTNWKPTRPLTTEMEKGSQPS